MIYSIKDYETNYSYNYNSVTIRAMLSIQISYEWNLYKYWIYYLRILDISYV